MTSTEMSKTMDRQTWQQNAKMNLYMVSSAFYCYLAVIMGFALPISQVLSAHRLNPVVYHLYYSYMYLASIASLFFLNTFGSAQNVDTSNQGFEVSKHKVRGSSRSDGRVVYGSVFARLGVIFFGIGSMMYSGIEVGAVMEFCHLNATNDDNGSDGIFLLIRPILRLIFIFFQMYFIFLNRNMNFSKSRWLTRMCLMHLISTNIAVWFNVLIVETYQEIVRENRANEFPEGSAGLASFSPQSILSYIPSDATSSLIPLVLLVDCSDEFKLHELSDVEQRVIMHRLLVMSDPFLCPCMIEFVLTCSCILYMMWKHIDEDEELQLKELDMNTRQPAEQSDNAFRCEGNNSISGVAINNNGSIENRISTNSIEFIDEIDDASVLTDKPKSNSKDEMIFENSSERDMETKTQDTTVDDKPECSNVGVGLFSGIVLTVVTIVSLAVFFILISSENVEMREKAIWLTSITELSLYTITFGVVILATFQVRSLHYNPTPHLDLDLLLLVVSQMGVLIYSIFCIIASIFQEKQHLISFFASLFTMFQTTTQTIFILDASNRYTMQNESEWGRRGGRHSVTFLIMSNMAMWAINTIETNRVDSHPIDVGFYGNEWVWAIIIHITMPLAIFYRFHSTVCLCEIWTRAFKVKPPA